jgi:hypothetical protein
MQSGVLTRQIKKEKKALLSAPNLELPGDSCAHCLELFVLLSNRDSLVHISTARKIYLTCSYTNFCQLVLNLNHKAESHWQPGDIVLVNSQTDLQ